MRPLDRFRKDRARENATDAIPEFNTTQKPPTRTGPRCIGMTVTYEMPDGSHWTTEGVWPAVDYLPLDLLAAAVDEKARARERDVRRKMDR